MLHRFKNFRSFIRAVGSMSPWIAFEDIPKRHARNFSQDNFTLQMKIGKSSSIPFLQRCEKELPYLKHVRYAYLDFSKIRLYLVNIR